MGLIISFRRAPCYYFRRCPGFYCSDTYMATLSDVSGAFFNRRYRRLSAASAEAPGQGPLMEAKMERLLDAPLGPASIGSPKSIPGGPPCFLEEVSRPI